MSVPFSSRTVMRVRGVALWMLRVIAIFMVIYGLYLILARFAFAMLLSQGVRSLDTYQGVGEDHGIVRGIPMMLAGIALALLSRKLSRWMIGVPDTGCVRCRYAGGGRSEGPCPECGYDEAGPRTTASD